MKRLRESLGILGVLFGLCLISSWQVDGFASLDNAKGLLQAVSTVGLIACTMMLCLGTADVDLSIGSTAALSGVVATVLVKSGQPATVAVAAALGAGLLVGAINGVVIAGLGVNALIATLASMQFVRGAAYLIAPGGTSIGVSDEAFIKIGTWEIWGIRAPIWYMVAGFVVFGLLLNRTVFGRNALAIGGNMESARLAGIPVVRTRVAIFMLQGFIAAFAGVVLAARVSSGQPQAQVGLELQVISACVLGGVSLTGGVASMTGVVGGVLIMGVVQNAMSLRSIDTYWQMVVSGVVLLAAVLLDRLKAARR